MATPFKPFSRARVSFFMKRALKYSMVALVSFFIAYVIIKPYKATEMYVVAPTPDFSHFNADKLFALINEWRTSHGLQKIIKNQVLCDSATTRAVEVRKDWSHNGFDAKRACRELECEMGENLAKSINSEEDVLNSWIESPGHMEVLSYPDYKYGCAAEVDGFVALHLSDMNLKY